MHTSPQQAFALAALVELKTLRVPARAAVGRWGGAQTRGAAYESISL